MNEWRLMVDTLDMDWEWGLCVGQYDGAGKAAKPIKRHAIRFDKHAPSSKVAAELRALADFVEQKMGELNER